jgi:hypothetical protein
VRAWVYLFGGRKAVAYQGGSPFFMSLLYPQYFKG